MNKRYDWIGYERTFQNILQKIRVKTEDEYIAHNKLFIKNKTPKIAINIVCLIIVILITYFAPIGFELFKEKTGYFQKDEISEPYETDASQSGEPSDKVEDVIVVIHESLSNIRSAPGTENASVAVAEKGDTFIATGNEGASSSGTIWYEIYINEDRTETGWVSETVATKQTE